MTFKEISKLDKSSIPAGKEAEYAQLIKSYIVHKNKVMRAFITAFTACVAALVLFIAIGRASDVLGGYRRAGRGVRILRGGRGRKYVSVPKIFKKV